MNLVATLHERARHHPERVAIHDTARGRESAVTYRQLSQRAAAGARLLRAHGLQPGESVLLLHPVSIELYEVLLAVFHAGMTAMLIDPGPGRAFMERCCRRRPPRAFFGSRKAHLLRLAVPSLRRLRPCFHSNGWLPHSSRWSATADADPPAPCDPDTPALVTFTSGSTGDPKAAVRTHGFLQTQYEFLARSLDLRDGEVDLATLPVFVLANLAAGVTSVLSPLDLGAPRRNDLADLYRRCEHLRVTRCTASPALFEKLLAHPGFLPAFSSIFTGGAPVFPDLLDRLCDALPDARIHAVYGSTEAEPVAEFEIRDLRENDRERSRSGGGLPAGRPVPGLDLRILPDTFGEPLGPLSQDEFDALALPPDTVGEIVVAGPHVLRGYLDGVGDHETKIQVAETVWHRTGDAGCLDPGGNLWLHGRCSARLPGGRYPLAIEAAVRDLPGRPRTAALARNGVTLVVEGHPSPALATAIRGRAGHLLDHLVFLPRIPLDRRHHAKTDYPALHRALDRRAPQ